MPGVFRHAVAPTHAAQGADRWTKALRILHLQPEAYIAGLAAFSILAHLIVRYGLGGSRWAFDAPLIIAIAVGGIPLLIDLGKHMVAGEFGADLLAGISILTAVLMGQYLVGAIVVLMLSGGAALEQYATHRASSVLNVL